MTKEYTATSDRQCTTVDVCKNGVIDGTSIACTCPGTPHCSECFVQRTTSNGVLLVQDGGAPKVSASLDPDNPMVVIPGNIEPLLGCRDLCLASTECSSFFVHVAGESRGSCFLKTSYTVSRGLEFTANAAFYALPSCSKCNNGYVEKERGCAG